MDKSKRFTTGEIIKRENITHDLWKIWLKIDEKFRSQLKSHGLLTRDAREVERKKYGQPGARKKFQFSKR